MKPKAAVLLFFLLAFWFSLTTSAQFVPEEMAEFEKWETALENAELVEFDRMGGREAVTEPYVLTLKAEDGTTFRGLWKNPSGRVKGFIEGWQWEIAAYRLSKHLGLDMVPPTVERRFQGNRGSCQLWIENSITLKQKVEEDIKTPSYKIAAWNKALYLQRAFDNLIANEDRHQNQFLIIRDEVDYTKDFRMILIDHSRSFRTTKKFTDELIYTEKYKEGPRPMSKIPRDFFEKLKALNAQMIQELCGEYLTEKEIECVMARRDLIVEWINKEIKKEGEDTVLY